MKEVYIFDIDGCVMPPIFTNYSNSEPRKNIVKEVIKNGNHVKLFPSFIEFYKKHCTHAESIFFITGRKYSEFGKLTEEQLQILTEIKNFHVIYYPERKTHKIKKYFTWKIKEIKDIINNIIKSKSSYENSKEKDNFNIFDDLNDYFPKIRKFGDKWRIQIHLTLIESENNWIHLL